MKPIIIFGAGEIAQIARTYFEQFSERKIVAFTVDKQFLKGKTFDGLPLISSDEISSLYPASDFDCFVAISYQNMNETRKAKCELMRSLGYQLASFVFPDFSTRNVSKGDNCLILENNTIQPFVEIGNNVFLWSGNHIGHHVKISDDVFVSSHVVIGGGTVIGSGSFLGLNVTVRDHVTIGERSLLGAGTLVGQDLSAESVVTAKPSPISKVKSSMIGKI
jgi:sugar O-acyltransferase (sialic acid O-acetyltransferase NeuD family)